MWYMVCIYILHIGREEKRREKEWISHLKNYWEKRNRLVTAPVSLCFAKGSIDKKRRMSARVLVFAAVDIQSLFAGISQSESSCERRRWHSEERRSSSPLAAGSLFDKCGVDSSIRNVRRSLCYAMEWARRLDNYHHKSSLVQCRMWSCLVEQLLMKQVACLLPVRHAFSRVADRETRGCASLSFGMTEFRQDDWFCFVPLALWKSTCV